VEEKNKKIVKDTVEMMQTLDIKDDIELENLRLNTLKKALIMKL
jgi:hypothetical protein